MLFNAAFFSSLLLSPVVLALPSGLGTRDARRGESSQGNHPLERATNGGSGSEYSVNWAGAVRSDGSNGTFSSVTGTFTVPNASGTDGSSALIFLSLDGSSCSNSTLGVGVSVTVGNSVSYDAWFQSSKDLYQFPDPIEISPGDSLRFTVDALSPNSGTATIDNLTNGQVMSEALNSSTSLCMKDAEWVVGASIPNPLADFGTVTFTNAYATGRGRTWNPSGANIVDMQQNGIVLTNVTTNETSVTIQYV